jgi:hypothetical protein
MTQLLMVKYKPHPKQSQFHNSKARFRMLNTGRRFGKTVAGANETIKQMIKSGKGAVGFVVAPTYWHTTKCWREFLSYCPRQVIEETNRTERRITMVGNRTLWFKSAEDPDSLRSEGLDFLWVDECAEVKENAWILALRPALMDRHGKAIFTTTPKGHNWFFQLWTRGQDQQQTDYESWLFPSVANPYLDPKEIAAFARDMPEFAYRQEILGEFMEDVGSVFRGVETCVKGTLQPPSVSSRYMVGVDLAKHEDYTVLCTLSSEGHLCSFKRFGEVDWVLQKKRVLAEAKQYNNARILIDSTGVGDPIHDDLRRSGIHVEGYKFTNASKAELVENLSIMIEQQRISFPDIPELVNELKLFSYQKTLGGTIRYGAPQGYHDDCVISLALAAWLNRKPGKIQVSRGHVPW